MPNTMGETFEYNKNMDGENPVKDEKEKTPEQKADKGKTVEGWKEETPEAKAEKEKQKKNMEAIYLAQKNECKEILDMVN